VGFEPTLAKQTMTNIPGIEKLVEVVASGIGAVAGPMLAPWAATRRAKARIIDARAEGESMRIIAQAQADAQRILAANPTDLQVESEGDAPIIQRLDFQERKRHQNILSVVGGAADALENREVPDQEPDHDWTARFFEFAQDVSDDDVRAIWAKILAGEVRSPGSVSLRTLSVLRDMSRSDAELFREALRYRLTDTIPWYFTRRVTDEICEHDLSHKLLDLGLCYSHTSSAYLRWVRLDAAGRAEFVNADHALIIRGQPGAVVDAFTGGVTVLNNPGIELAQFCDAKWSPAFLDLLATFLHKRDPNGFTLDAAPLIEIAPDGPRYDKSKLRRIAPLDGIDV